ncbi:MAG: TPM domain-containing protein [Paracoccaceae bacterium]
MLRSLMLAIAVLFALPAFADPYPEYTSTTVNDFADLLEPEYEATLVEVLAQLKKDTGVEMVVVTMDTLVAYDKQSSFEAFATGLFNHWGIGDRAKNDGIMVLVVRDDRDMRIELGSGYDGSFDAIAGGIIDDKFLQSFKQDNYRRGIMRGVDDIITRIALPNASGETAKPVKSSGDKMALGFATMLFGLVWGLIFRNRIGDSITRWKRCPTCGKRKLHRSRQVTEEQVGRETGAGEEEISCSNCDYRHVRLYPILPPSKSGSSGSSFGGGSSSGGGASGKW